MLSRNNLTMSGGVDVARGYDPNFPDSRGLQKDKVEMVGVDLENRFKTKSKGFEMPSASSIGGQLKKGLKPPEYFTRPKDEWDPLIIASLHGDISRVEDLLKREKRDVNVVTKRERYTALMAASGNGHSKVAKLLISHNAVHNLTTSAGVSALMMACHAGHYDTAKILLENGADPNKQDKDRYTALIYASINGFYRILELLLSHNADVNLKEWRQTALMAACYYGHYDVVELLIKNKAQINTQDINNFTALMYASGNNHYEVVKLLLDHNAKVNIENCYQGSTALSLACDQQRFAIAKLLIEKVKHTHNANKVLNFGLMAASNAGHYTLVKLLIENGAQVRCEDYLGNSPLSLACRQGHYEVTKLLLNRGAMHNVSILVRASYFGYFKIVKLLVKKGATVNMYDQGRVTALIAACTGGHYIIAELLLENDANPNLLDKFSGTSPLMIASSKGYYNLAKQLINKKAQLDLQSSDNFLSALMFASMQGHYSICKLLLRRGANMELLNKEERSALMLSANSEITRLLLDSGAKVDHQDYFGHTALSLAGDYDTTLLLLERGADVNLQAKDEETALVRSCRHGLYDVTKLLLDHGANPNIQDNIKFSPLHYAAKSGNVRVVKLLLNRGAEPSLRGGHGGTPLTLAQNVETLNLLIAKTDVQTKDLLIALNYAASTNNAPVLDYLYEKYPDIVGLQSKYHDHFRVYNYLMLHFTADSTFPNIAFFKDKVEKWITPTKGAEIECSGLSISIPKGVTTEKADLPIIIRPCFGGPFELPADYVSASPAYLVQLQSREQVTINKDVTVRIHHYADLQTEEDCEDMVFLSASLAPHKDYRFEKINGVCGLFRAGDSVGEIKLRHFCLIKVARWVGRKLRRRHNRVSPGELNYIHLAVNSLHTSSLGNIDRYSARLYRNMSPDAYSGVSAVFCVCLDHPLYIEV